MTMLRRPAERVRHDRRCTHRCEDRLRPYRATGETGEGLDYFPLASPNACTTSKPTTSRSSACRSAAHHRNPHQTTPNEQITVAHDYDIDVVAAAGNDSGPLQYPADDPTVLSVGAMNSAHQLCRFSSIGARLLESGCELDTADPAQAGRIATTAPTWMIASGRLVARESASKPRGQSGILQQRRPLGQRYR